MYPIDVPHLAKICTSHVPHSGTSVPHLGPDEMAALDVNDFLASSGSIIKYVSGTRECR
jgi:hypothetical protein